MKFSLFSLIVLILLAALTINFLLLQDRYHKSIANVSDIEAKTEALAKILPDKEKIKEQHRSLTVNNELQTETSTLLHERFVKHTDTKYQIKPVAGKFSVLERPEYRTRQLEYLKTFMLNVPESQQLKIQVEFQPDRSPQAGAGEFETTEDAYFAIPYGMSKLVVAFTEVKQEGSDQTDWYLKISIDDAEVVSRLFVENDRHNGFGWSNFPFDPQRNYATNDRLPRIARFSPSHGKSSVQLTVVRVGSGDQ